MESHVAYHTRHVPAFLCESEVAPGRHIQGFNLQVQDNNDHGYLVEETSRCPNQEVPEGVRAAVAPGFVDGHRELSQSSLVM